MEDTKLKCKLCGRFFDDEEMSEEHYPARSVGNEDIVALNIVKMLDSFQSEEIRERIKTKLSDGESIERISGDIFDNELAESLYPHGRTARTLCRKCNTFLGKYDEAYLKFFSLDGEAKAIKGFSKKTKLHIVKEALIKAGKGEVSSQKRRKCQGKERIEGRNPWNSYTSQLKGRKSPMRVGVNRPLWQAYTDLRWRRARVIG